MLIISNLLNKEVTAIGDCGMGKDKTVVGILTQIEPYPIVEVGENKRHYSVYKASIVETLT